MMNTKTFIAALATSALTAAASAGTAPISIVSGATHSNVDLEITIKASERAGYDYDFVLANNSGYPGASVTGVYFESGWSALINSGALSGDGALGASSSTPGISGWAGNSAAYEVGKTVIGQTRHYVNRSWRYVDTYGDNTDAGIEEGELGIFSFTSSATLNDLELALGNSGYNVGVRIQDVVSDAQASGWGLADAMPPSRQEIKFQEELGEGGGEGGSEESNAVSAPTPTAALAGLAVLGLAGFRRRRD